MPPGPPPTGNEAALVRQLQSHDERAIEQIYRQFGHTTLRYLIHVLGDRAIAEDVQQQVFIEVWKRGANYDRSRGGLLTWIMQIARSRAIDQMRKRVPEPIDPHGRAVTEMGPDLGFNVDALADQWQMAHYLEQLPDDEAKLLRMRFVDDKSQVEISSETGVALGTVKKRMVTGLRRLRKLMEAEGMDRR